MQRYLAEDSFDGVADPFITPNPAVAHAGGGRNRFRAASYSSRIRRIRCAPKLLSNARQSILLRLTLRRKHASDRALTFVVTYPAVNLRFARHPTAMRVSANDEGFARAKS
jgi:hypothetical protein